jgi:hypothetical protein
MVIGPIVQELIQALVDLVRDLVHTIDEPRLRTQVAIRALIWLALLSVGALWVLSNVLMTLAQAGQLQLQDALQWLA